MLPSEGRLPPPPEVRAQTMHREVLFAAIAMYFLFAGLSSIVYFLQHAPGSYPVPIRQTRHIRSLIAGNHRLQV